jgi:hypothetical protein
LLVFEDSFRKAETGVAATVVSVETLLLGVPTSIGQ